VAVCVTVFLIGPLVTVLPVAAYFGSTETWTYLLGNATLVGGQRNLPGVFEMNTYRVANGSLWTLRYEAILYVALACIGTVARRGYMRYALPMALVFVALAWCAGTAYGLSELWLPLPVLWRIGLELDGM